MSISLESSPQSQKEQFLFVNEQWNNQFYIRLIEPCDYTRVIEYMTLNYVYEEPVNRWLATNPKLGKPEEYISDYTQFLHGTLPQNLSLMAIDMRTNKIAGVRLTKLRTSIQRESPGSNNPIDYHFQSKGFKALCTFKTFLETQADIFNRFGINSYPDMTGVFVDNPYRRQGLLTQMYDRAMDLYKSLGHTIVKTVFLNPISQKAGLKLGFIELSRANYSSFKDENGNLVFPEFEKEHLDWFAPLMVSML